jgi:thioredoxin 1
MSQVYLLLERKQMSVRLLYFYADWAGPCAEQDQIINEVETSRPEVTVERINVDEQESVANEYQVRSLPTMVVEGATGTAERFVGVTQRSELEASLEQAKSREPDRSQKFKGKDVGTDEYGQLNDDI